ncbi:MAG: tetratricopeptide repeat protein [Thermodesulfobacteriota bacterium]
MKWKRPEPQRLGLCIFFLWAWMLHPSASEAANRVMDLKWIQAPDGRKTLALLLEKEPRYSLRSESGSRVLLHLYDATPGPNLGKALEAQGKTISLEEDASDALRMSLLVRGALREADCSWFERQKVLFLQLTSGEEGRSRRSPKESPLKSLRFGTQEDLTRMVADLSTRPDWEMNRREPGVLVFTLNSTTAALQRAQYGPLRRLRRVEVGQKGEAVEIRAETESPPTRTRMFWLKDGGKWVVDFFDTPLESALDTLQFAPVPPEKAPEKPAVTAPVTAQAQLPEIGRGEPKAEEKEEKVPVQDPPGAQQGVSPADPVSVVRMKISKDLPARSPGETPPTRGLRPPEAFLYGRIRGAMETMDYQKGLVLIEEFMRQFPDSPLSRDMSFLAADCRFALMEAGDKSLLPKVLQGYQDALAGAPASERAGGALVKMAQANLLAGNDQEAMGHLGMAIGQAPEGTHVPQALVLRGQVCLRTNQVEKAIQDFKAVMERYPSSPFADEARYGVAGYFHGVGLYDQAEKRLREIDASKPRFYLDHPGYLLLRARNAFYQKNYDRAREYYFRALNVGQQPEGPDLLLSHIGDTYYHQSQEREAGKFYRMAVEYYPESEGASIAKLRMASQGTGITAYEEIHRKNINKPIGDLALLEMAARFYAQGEYPLAVETLKKLMGKSGQPDIQREARQLYFRSAERQIRRLYDAKELEQLIAYYQSADPVLTGNVDPEILLLVGEALHHQQRHGEAISLFLQIGPRDLNAASRGRYVTTFARSYLAQRDDENALKVLERNQRESLPPEVQQQITLLLAGTYEGRGDHMRALELYQNLLADKGLLSEREMAGAYFAMGRIFNRMHRYEKARESLNRCIALAERDRESKNLLRSALAEMGSGYYQDGRYHEAIRFYQQSLELEAGNEGKGYWERRYQLALSHLGAGDQATAERMMSEIAEEGDPSVQQKAQVKIGLMGLDKQLKRLPLERKGG